MSGRRRKLAAQRRATLRTTGRVDIPDATGLLVLAALACAAVLLGAAWYVVQALAGGPARDALAPTPAFWAACVGIVFGAWVLPKLVARLRSPQFVRVTWTGIEEFRRTRTGTHLLGATPWQEIEDVVLTHSRHKWPARPTPWVHLHLAPRAHGQIGPRTVIVRRLGDHPEVVHALLSYAREQSGIRRRREGSC